MSAAAAMSATVTSSGGCNANRPIAASITADRRDGRWGGRFGNIRPRIGLSFSVRLSNAGGIRITTREQASHRPSRRNLIVDAAVKVFSDQGFSDASIHDIARE